MKIKNFRAIEILDSRGRPTLKVYCQLSNQIVGEASVPAGASKGEGEAMEIRDGNPARFGGYGCLKAIQSVQEKIHPELSGMPIVPQFELDQRLLDLDGTSDKSNLGANTILGVSLAYARAVATLNKEPFYSYFGSLLGISPSYLPRLTINLFSGGLHAGSQVPIQDVLIIPLISRTVLSSLESAFRVYSSAVELIRNRYGMRWLTADEGGLAPPFTDVPEMLSTAVEAIELAGFGVGTEIALGIDMAASQFCDSNKYYIDRKVLSGQEMVSMIEKWTRDYPIISVEDGLAQEHWDGWNKLNLAIGDSCQVLGDDLLCTRVDRMRKAKEFKAANALLLKPNQVGTLLEASRALQLAREFKWRVSMSARSGETEDNWLSDLAVGWEADQIKIGSITQSDRLSKYNRLLEIEAETGLPLKEWALEDSNL